MGCGIGGSAFLMKQKFNLDVDAIDLSDNMLELAKMRLAEAGLAGQVSLANENCLEIETKDATTASIVETFSFTSKRKSSSLQDFSRS